MGIGRLWGFAWFAVFGVSILLGERAGQAEPSPASANQSAPVRVYSPGNGVAAPNFVPAKLDLDPIDPCDLKVDGKVYLSFLVDTIGVPRNLTFIQPIGSDLDMLALRIVSEDRFSPGTLSGTPVVVAQSVVVTLKTCVLQFEDKAGHRSYKLRLRLPPDQNFSAMQNPPKEAIFNDAETDGLDSLASRIGGSVIAPVPLYTLEVKMLKARRKLRYQETCLISVTIDTRGMPIAAKVLRGINPDLDSKALEAVNSFRFRPATKSGRPVAVRQVMEVSFRFY
jgi:TonB family protein